ARSDVSMPRSTWPFCTNRVGASRDRASSAHMFLKLATSITNHDNRLSERDQVPAGVQSIGELCSSALTLELLTYRPCVERSVSFPSHLTHGVLHLRILGGAAVLASDGALTG